jgi:two-component system, OmpR family, phosphate regulon sensor histidine kinase PhoR
VSDRRADVFPGGIDPRALPDLTTRMHSAHRLAATVTAVFAVAGMAWVFVTDVVLYGVGRDRAFIARVETAKGWIFITLASLLLYAVTFRGAARLDRVRRLTAAVVASIADGILLLGHDRRIAHANPAAVRMLRCARDELIGMDASQFSQRFRIAYPSGALVPPDRYVSQRVFEEGGPLQYKAILHPPGGGRLVISATAAGVRMELGAPATWVVSVMHDITDSDQLERLRDQFFTSAAHSLKTPVAIIKAHVQALPPAAAPRQEKIVASIDRQCDRIDRLVQNLLVLSRARSHSLELHLREVELSPLVERIAQEGVWSYRHDVRTDIAGPLSLHADQERLALVIRNLLYEASRLSPADSCLTLLARPEGDRVAVGVRYHPIPWAEQVSSVYGEYDDIGIGRSVAETIVEGHGGSLSEETSDAETTSWIHLPGAAGAQA